MEVRPGYKQTEVGVIPEEWETLPIGSIASFTSGQGIDVALLAEQSSDTPIAVYGGNGIAGYTTDPLVHERTVVVGRVGQRCGEVYLTSGPAWVTDNALYPRRFLRTPDLGFLASAMKAARLNAVKNRNDLPLVTQAILHSVVIGVPKAVAEQRAIATALSDVDALLGGLDRLIAKKRDLKQAAMQQLLSGETRFPGFHGEWELKPLSAVLDRLNTKAHQIRSSEYHASARYPVVDQGKDAVVAFSDRGEKRFHCPDGGVIVFGDHTCTVKYIDFDFLVGADGTQVLRGKAGQLTRYHAFQLQYRGIESTGYNRHFSFLKERVLVTPPAQEQLAIASILSDMDSGIAALEVRREKTRLLKQGMMQELLTGRTRLV